MLKVVLIGPESTGKSTLAAQLAEYYNVGWVREFAREYIEKLNRLYIKSDLLEIAKGQIRLEEEALKAHQSKKLIIFDTNLIVLKVWSLNAYGSCDDWIFDEIDRRDYDLYFLCGIDTPWEFDEQREHPHMRAHFYEIYKNELIEMNANFVELKGNKAKRLLKAVKIIDEYMDRTKKRG